MIALAEDILNTERDSWDEKRGFLKSGNILESRKKESLESMEKHPHSVSVLNRVSKYKYSLIVWGDLCKKQTKL